MPIGLRPIAAATARVFVLSATCCDLPVRAGPAQRDVAQRRPYRPLELTTVRRHRKVEVRQVAAEVRVELLLDVGEAVRVADPLRAHERLVPLAGHVQARDRKLRVINPNAPTARRPDSAPQ